jgi:hypothetical protein
LKSEQWYDAKSRVNVYISVGRHMLINDLKSSIAPKRIWVASKYQMLLVQVSIPPTHGTANKPKSKLVRFQYSFALFLIRCSAAASTPAASFSVHKTSAKSSGEVEQKADDK